MISNNLLLFSVTLTYLEDEENAKHAYDQAMQLEAKDPTICLNYAIFLHNHNDLPGAINMYKEFQARLQRYRQISSTDLDYEVNILY